MLQIVVLTGCGFHFCRYVYNMDDITTLGALLNRARQQAGLSQAELAQRANTSQPAIARFESGQANPTVATIERVLAAAGFALRFELVPLQPPDPVVEAYKNDVDRTTIRENLRRSIDDRLRMNEESMALGAELQRAVSAQRAVASRRDAP